MLWAIIKGLVSEGKQIEWEYLHKYNWKLKKKEGVKVNYEKKVNDNYESATHDLELNDFTKISNSKFNDIFEKVFKDEIKVLADKTSMNSLNIDLKPVILDYMRLKLKHCVVIVTNKETGVEDMYICSSKSFVFNVGSFDGFLVKYVQELQHLQGDTYVEIAGNIGEKTKKLVRKLIEEGENSGKLVETIRGDIGDDTLLGKCNVINKESMDFKLEDDYDLLQKNGKEVDLSGKMKLPEEVVDSIVKFNSKN